MNFALIFYGLNVVTIL